MLFFFNDTATTEIYTLSLHDALPISGGREENSQTDHRAPWEVASARMRRGLSEGWIEHIADARYGANVAGLVAIVLDRKSTRLNSSHANISYAVFCLKKKNKLSIT